MRVAIIVLNYNGADCLIDCLRSLCALQYQEKEIIVVDNGSTDNSLSVAQRAFPQCLYKENKENKGFAGGMNVGIREALRRGAEYCWLFNSDAKAEPDALNHLILAAEKYQDAGLLSPRIISSLSGRPWFLSGKIEYYRMRVVHSTPSRASLIRPAYESEFLTGCALFIKRDVFERIGLLDECFFLYYEDADFCCRAKKAGFRLLVAPDALVQHKEKSQENPKKIYYLVYSGLLFFQKHTPWWARPYVRLYGTIRRIKNLWDCQRSKKNALLVRRAYARFYDTPSKNITDFCQL